MGYDIAEKLLSNGFQMVAKEKIFGCLAEKYSFLAKYQQNSRY